MIELWVDKVTKYPLLFIDGERKQDIQYVECNIPEDWMLWDVPGTQTHNFRDFVALVIPNEIIRKYMVCDRTLKIYLKKEGKK